MADTLYERYNTGDTSYTNIQGDAWLAQTFTVGNTGSNIAHVITSVKLKLFRLDLPGTITVGIRAVDGAGKPTGADLTYGTTDGKTLTTDTGGEWREIVFETAYTLVAGTQYAIVVRQDVFVGGIVRWRLDLSDSTYTGGVGYYDTVGAGVSWATWATTADFMFEEYGYVTTVPPTAAPRDVYYSGYLTRLKKRQIVGYYNVSGDLRSVEVNASGHFFTDVEVVQSSGLHVLVSGQPVTISGDHVFVESGAFVTTQPGIQVSGLIDVEVLSGQIHMLSGVMTLESGGYVIAPDVCSPKIRTGKPLVTTAASGGQSLCVSGQWCSGFVHIVTVKALSGEVFVGESGCKPYTAGAGYGYHLNGREEITLDVCNICNIYAVAVTSGSHVGYIGTDY